VWYTLLAMVPPSVIVLGGLHFREQTREFNRDTFDRKLEAYLGGGGDAPGAAGPPPRGGAAGPPGGGAPALAEEIRAIQRRLDEISGELSGAPPAPRAPPAAPAGTGVGVGGGGVGGGGDGDEFAAGAAPPPSADMDLLEEGLKWIGLRDGPSQLSNPWVRKWVLRTAWEDAVRRGQAAWGDGAGGPAGPAGSGTGAPAAEGGPETGAEGGPATGAEGGPETGAEGGPAAVVEPATGVAFPASAALWGSEEMECLGAGVRRKALLGPVAVQVYAVAAYADRERWRGAVRGAPASAPDAELGGAVARGAFDRAYLLEMVRGVSGEALGGAMREALRGAVPGPELDAFAGHLAARGPLREGGRVALRCTAGGVLETARSAPGERGGGWGRGAPELRVASAPLCRALGELFLGAASVAPGARQAVARRARGLAAGGGEGPAPGPGPPPSPPAPARTRRWYLLWLA